MNVGSLNFADGETKLVSNQWAQQTEKKGTTVSSSTWTYSGSCTLAGPTLVTPLATVLFTPTTDGILKNTAILSNGETLIDTWTVYVE